MAEQKKYINFIEMYRKAYPDLQKERQWWVVEGGVVDVKFWTFAGGGNKIKGGGSKFWSFCENVIIECPSLQQLHQILQTELNFYLVNIYTNIWQNHDFLSFFSLYHTATRQ